MTIPELHCRLIDIQARFAEAYALGRLSEAVPELFKESEHVSVRLPWMEAPATDLPALQAAVREHEALQISEPHIFHTPHIELSEENAGGGSDAAAGTGRDDSAASVTGTGRDDSGDFNGTAYVTWETYGYRIDRTGANAVMITTRFAAAVEAAGDTVRFVSADWTQIGEFLPQDYLFAGTDHAADPGTIPVKADMADLENAADAGLTPGTGRLPAAKDFFAIRNMTNILFANNWRDCARFFTETAEADADDLTGRPLSGLAEVSAWLDSIGEYERSHNGWYRAVMISGPGALYETEDGRVRGRWLTHSFEVSEHPVTGNELIRRRIFLMDNEYIRTEGQWKIQKLRLSPLFRLPELEGTNRLYQRMLFDKDSNWLCRQFDPDTGSEKVALAAENIFSFWPLCVHRAQLSDFFRNFIKNDVYTPVMSIRSQGPQTPARTGDAEILDKLVPMEAGYVPGQITYHCATTPVIQLDKDGETVHASWIDHSLTNFGPKEGQDHVDYMVFVTRYDHVFKKAGGKWCLVEFNWEPCLGLPFYKAPKDGGSGWAGRYGREELYPFPLHCRSLEEYREKGAN